MRRVIGAVIAALCLLCVQGRAFASDRIIYQLGEQLPPSWLNQGERNHRVEIGSILLHEGIAGTYANLSVQPSSGLYVVVRPTLANTYGAIYQLVADDTSPYGDSVTALPADTTQVVAAALMSTQSAAIGPLTAPTAPGQEIDYLVEAQVVPSQDNTEVSTPFVDNLGNVTTKPVNEIRSDDAMFVVKASTPAVNPSQPAVDAGYIAIANVVVSTAQTTISSSNISMVASTQFNGFAQVGTVTANTCAYFDANKHLSSGGCNTAYGAPTTISAGSTNVSVTQPTSANYQIDLSQNPSVNSITTTTATVNGSATIPNSGTATATTNYGSTGAVQVQSSLWNGSAAVQHTWGATADTSGNLSFQFDSVPKWTLDSSGNVVATAFKAGSSSYGSTSASVAGTVTGSAFSLQSVGTGVDANHAINFPTTFGSGSVTTFIGTDSAHTVSGVNGQFFAVEASNGPNPLLAVDGFANLGIGGSFKTGTSSYGPTAATVNGYVYANTGGTGGAAIPLQIAGNNGGTTISANTQAFAGTNYSNGNAETDLWDTYNGAANTTPAFNFYGFQNLASTPTLLAQMLRNGNFVLPVSGGSYVAGSSSYGPTSATVNGPISATTGTFTGGLTLNGTNNTFTGTDFYIGSQGTTAGTIHLRTSGYTNSDTALITSGGTYDALNASGLRASFGGSAANGDLIMNSSSATAQYIGCTGASQNCTLSFYTGGTGSPSTAHIDGSGNITAANFIQGSRREWKMHITPYKFDALHLLGTVDYAEYDCKTWQCGPTGMHKVGIIANDSPWQVTSKKHDHYDAFAMAAIDGKAITELNARFTLLSNRVDGLEAMVKRLCREKKNRKEKVCRAYVH